jgi:hypothetical protein
MENIVFKWEGSQIIKFITDNIYIVSQNCDNFLNFWLNL